MRNSCRCYQGWDSPAPVPHSLNPYHITCLNGVWYLLAGTPQRAKSHQYALHRMSSPTLTNQPILTKSDVAPDDLARKSFGQFVGTGKTEILKVRFSKAVTRHVADFVWHPEQHHESEPDGSLVVTFPIPVSSSDKNLYLNALRWVLSFGENIEVLEPVALRLLVREAARAMASKHG